MTIRRSLRASPEGIETARRALIQNSLTQLALAEEELKISRSTVDNFFKGKPVDRRYFIQICERLNLEWDEIVAKPPSKPEAESSHDNGIDIDALVQQVRQHCHDRIQSQCGKINLLGISQPVELDNLYINVNILEDIPSQRCSNISERIRNFDPTADDHNHFYLGKVPYQRLQGLKVVKDECKVMVLGRPGSGKTTFLQYVAIECNQGRLQAERVPIFIKLLRFAEDSRDKGELILRDYIDQEFCRCGVDYLQPSETLLVQGKALILLDGLDEVPDADSKTVLKRIRQFCDYYYKNSIIITCRINAQEYRFKDLGFTEVEVADFNQVQIETFAKKWFVAVARNDRTVGEAKAKQFIEKLRSSPNKRIRDLAVTPILLNLTCLVFDDMGDFPSNQAKLYKRGLDILLKEWDESKGIQRNEVYKNLDLEGRKELLTQIAAATFEKNRYFFEQSEIQQYIADNICTLTDAQTNQLQMDSEAVLKSIEVQHGLLVERAQEIYSFSHLTFQEYFTARKIVNNSNPQTLKHLVNCITETRWHEVCLLAASMTWNADKLQMLKQQIDVLIFSDKKLQRFLSWINQKSLVVEVACKVAAVRAFYFNLTRLGIRNLTDDSRDYSELSVYIDYDFRNHFTNSHDLITDFYITCIFKSVREHDAFLKLAIKHTINPELKQLLQEFKEQLPPAYISKKGLEKWRTANEKAWVNKLRTVIIEHRNIGQNWQFSVQQKDLLNRYYNANKFLLNCLNNGWNVSREVRSQIEDTLLLPIAEIEQRKG